MSGNSKEPSAYPLPQGEGEDRGKVAASGPGRTARSASSFPRLANWWRARRAKRKRLAQASKAFDLRWARWLVTLSAPLTVANFLPFGKVLEWVAAVGTGAFAGGLCLYFAWLLFRRLPYSLLELLVLVAFLGNVEGLVLTTPGLANVATGSWALAALTAAWVLYGAVATLSQARILALEKPALRLLLLFGNWLILATPALVVVGAVLQFGGPLDGLISRNMQAWSAPLLALGGAGCVLYVWLSIKTRRAARRILGL
jgi:hypothetical protein